MINNGNNGGGNPNHASDGKFTSGPNQTGNGGNKVDKKENYESQIKEKLGIKNDANPSYEERMQNVMGIKKAEMPKKKFFISNSEGSLISEEPIEASSEEEAFEIASQMFPGRGEELFVNEDVEEEFEENGSNDSEIFQQFNDIMTEMEKAELWPSAYPEYDYDENGNKNGYDLKFSNPDEQKKYDSLMQRAKELQEKYPNFFKKLETGDEKEQDFDPNANYEQKIQKNMGINNPESPKKRYIKKDGMIIVVDENGKPTGEQYPSKENAEDINTTLNGWEEIEEKR